MVHYEIYIDHHSLQYIMSQRDLNVRQWQWIELSAYYDLSILSHLGKPNVVIDAFRRKDFIMVVAYLPTVEQPLALDIQSLVNRMVRLDILGSGLALAFIGTQSSLFGYICI